MPDKPKNLMLQAREAIQAGDYDTARAILTGLDNPTAKQWLEEIDTFAPPKTKKTNYSLIAYALIVAAVFIYVMVNFLLNSAEAPPDREATSIAITNAYIYDRTYNWTAIPLTDPLAIRLKSEVPAIAGFEAFSWIRIPGRDEVQYDFTVRLVVAANVQDTLNTISGVVQAYQADAANAPETTSMNVLVNQGILSENWRYSGTAWYLRAIDGLAVTATPYPTPLPTSAAPNVQANSNIRYTTGYNNRNNNNYGYYYGNTSNDPNGFGIPADCDEARAMGLTAREAGRYTHLDRDRDGVACYGD